MNNTIMSNVASISERKKYISKICPLTSLTNLGYASGTRNHIYLSYVYFLKTQLMYMLTCETISIGSTQTI